ncbi:MAG: glycoside hydrolase family 3 C-terminal domain-containing protein [Muribaculaceae bacterium]|nr:glycoside hydrolase family 3 C-terminal domain-containing protein [Muribaculaceae bacterium]
MKRLSTIIATAAMALTAMAANPDPARQKAEDMLSKLTLDEKISLMMDASPAIPRLNIPQFNWWSEALHGVARAGTATVLPQAIGMAATFDDAAVGEAFNMVSDEARAKFNGFRDRGDGLKRYEGLAFWTPNVNIFRDPRWGRGQETYGEDPWLTQTMGVAVMEGLQGPQNQPYMKTLAAAKHFAVHSGPEWNRHEFDAKDIDQRDLWETYLPSFKALVDSGVAQVMCAYNRYEGEPCCSNKRLLTQILRGEWGYDRVIVTDCWAMRDFVVDWGHHTHASEAEASSDAVISGTDLECGPMFKNLRKAYDQGLITEESINQAVLRVLTERFRLGEIDHASVPWDTLTVENTVDILSHRQIALDMARKSMTLLKNDGILPLAKQGKKILVMGPNAVDSAMQWGNYNGFPTFTTTILDGIRQYYPDARYLRGCDHVASADRVSVFNLFDGGMRGTYWNGEAGKSTPVAEATYTLPLSFDTGGATVFAPGVNLTDFSARYTGSFVPAEDGNYIIEFKGGLGREVVKVDGKEAIVREPGGRKAHTGSYMFTGHKGVPVEIEVDFRHFDDIATLSLDIMAPSREEIDFADVDVVIFVGGISPKLEGEEMKVTVPGFRGGDRETIELPAVQRDLVRRAHEAGKQVVFVNCSGSAVGLAPEDAISSAVLQAWYPGQAGGQAVAEVLFGDYNPAGRLPITFYASDAQLPDFQDYSMDGRTYRYFRGEPLYPFGHGLSYTTFDYGQPTVTQADGNVVLTVPVSNTGSMDGDEVVQVYLKNPSDPSGPIKTLRAYKRVNIPAGQTANVEFVMTPAQFATYDHATGRMTTRPGQYNLLVGPSSSKADKQVDVTL